jgi:hypothetical protein
VRRSYLNLVFGLGLLVVTSARAEALPVFAHRYGFTCQQCHTTVPHLNAFGTYFLRHGFRLPNGRGVFPIAVKTELDYTSGGGGDQDEPGGSPPLPKFIVNEIELLSAGSLGQNTSYYLEQYVVDGGEPGRPRDMWVNFNQYLNHSDPTATTLHARLGEFTLPLLYDPETQRPTITGYGLYSQTVGINPFNFFNDGIGADLYLTDDRTGLEAHLVTAEAYTPQSGIPKSGVDLMGTLSDTFANYLTLQAYRYQGQRAVTPTEDYFWRQGVQALYARGNFQFGGAIQTGHDSSDDGYGLGILSSGGFLQAAWTFNTSTALYARYDDTYDPFNLRQTDGVLDLVLRPRRNMRLNIEGKRAQNGSNQFGTQLLFAY